MNSLLGMEFMKNFPDLRVPNGQLWLDGTD